MNVSSYQLNHPKAYVGYTLAVAIADDRDDAEALVEEYVSGGIRMARRGAQNLRLVDLEDGDVTLTIQGQWVSEYAPKWFEADDQEGVLEELDDLRGARSRFCEQYPEFADDATLLARCDPTVDHLVNFLDAIHWRRIFIEDESYAITTTELYEEINDRNSEFAEAFFKTDGRWRTSATYTLKNVLWHLGILQSKGRQAKNLDPDELTWALETDIVTGQTAVAVENTEEVEASG